MTEQHPEFTLYSIGKGDVRLHTFYTFKQVWTIDELHDLAFKLKSYIQDEDISELKRLGRYDMLGVERVEKWDVMKSEIE